MRISICIPTYNKFRTIKYPILSVINQSYKNWELIILDDSDNDFTRNIVHKFSFKDKRIKYIKNTKRLGLVRNWNQCIKQSKFEYIYILHHDDYLMPGVLESYVNFAKNNPECGLIHSNCYSVTLPYFKKVLTITQNVSILKKGNSAVKKILFNNNLACSSVMVKKECYDKLGLFDEKAWVSPDWEMWARIARHYDLGHLDIIGCTVVLDKQNTHLSAIDIEEFYKQQKYYYNKIISYFVQNKNFCRKKMEEQAACQLKRTIFRQGLYYLENFNFKCGHAYLIKSQKITFLIYFYTLIKAIAKKISFLTKKKTSYKQAFTSIVQGRYEDHY